MHSLNLQLERLRRHYEVSVRTYDQVSLLDLSHTLRIWADLKTLLPPSFTSSRSFRSAVPPKRFRGAVRKLNYVLAYMPDGVATYACNGSFAEAPFVGRHSGSSMVGASVAHSLDGSLVLNNFCFLDGDFDESLLKGITEQELSRGNYAQWLSSEAVRVSFNTPIGSTTRLTISREMLIRRMANMFNASHPSNPDSDDGKTNRFDPAIRHLQGFKMGGLPLPYFILLKFAQDLLHVAPRLLLSKAKGAA